VERVSTTDVFDHLEVPMRRRPSPDCPPLAGHALAGRTFAIAAQIPASTLVEYSGSTCQKKGPQPTSARHSNASVSAP
jgi:hypothetical protein